MGSLGAWAVSGRPVTMQLWKVSSERVNLFVYGVVMFGGYRYLLTRSG